MSDSTSPATDGFTAGVLVGSIRRDSVSRKVATAMAGLVPAGLTLRPLRIDDLPLYDEDLDDGPPPAPWARFRAEVRAVDAILFVTPEYNRSVPAPLKNAVDVGSAPHGRNVFAGRPAGIVSLSPGRMGAFGANHHLRQSLVFLDMPTMQQPEAYLGGSDEMLGADGTLRSDAVRELLTGFLTAFDVWVAGHVAVPA
ncbi:ACP phosphodiesterase [Pseudonocardia sp. TMWB2A]|uniref:NADPH-dependent FMN reductase n=1 Tax=Pseudonocardia sp. TMWB2A TaxID=687430 RepID=UPI00307DE327